MAYLKSRVVSIAKSQIGYKERGQNDTKYNRWLGSIPGYPHSGFGYPWCHSFVSWVADQAGGEANKDFPRTAGCAVGVAWFKKRGRFGRTPHVGDFVYYGSGGSSHVEYVVAVHDSTITTVGGNTTGNIGDGRYANGDAVCEKSVSRSNSRIYGYGSPFYDAEPSKPSTPAPPKAPAKPVKLTVPSGSPELRRGSNGSRVKQLQQCLVKLGFKLPKFGVDSDYGDETLAAVKAFQRKYGLVADGVYGRKSAAKLKTLIK